MESLEDPIVSTIIVFYLIADFQSIQTKNNFEPLKDGSISIDPTTHWLNMISWKKQKSNMSLPSIQTLPP